MNKFSIKITKEKKLWKVSVPALGIEGIGYPDYEDSLAFASDLIAEYLKDFVPERIVELAEKDEEYFKGHSDETIRIDVDVEAYKRTIKRTAEQFLDEMLENGESGVSKVETQPEVKTSIQVDKRIIAAGSIGIIVVIIALVAFLLPNDSENEQTSVDTNTTTVQTEAEDYSEDDSKDDAPTDFDSDDFWKNMTGQNFAQIGDAKTVKITSSGFSYWPYWKRCEVGFVMENVSGSDYNNPQGIRVVIKNKKGEILSAEELFNSAPMKKGEITGRTEWYDVDSEPDTIEYQVIHKAKGTLLTDMTNLKVDNIRVSNKDGYGNLTVTGEIVNKTDKQYDYAAVYVLYKDKDDNIIGGRTESVSAVGVGKTAFSVDTSVPSEFDHSEVYAIGE